MIKRELSPKYLNKYSINNGNYNKIPLNWLEFASLCKIRSGAKIVNFNPYEYQKQLVECVDKHHTTLIVKTRQLGITETIGNYFLHKASLNSGYLAVIFSKTQSDTSNLAKRIRRQIESLNEYIKPETDSLTDIQLCNGGRILFRNSTPNGARGLESVSDILYDEAAFVDDIEEIYKSSIPCTTVVGDDAKIIILSTPNGQSGWFYDKLINGNGEDKNILQISEKMKSGLIAPMQWWTDNNGWCKYLLHWLDHPTFKLQKETYLNDIQRKFDLPIEIVEQEYNLSFTSSNDAIFNPNLVYQGAIGAWEDYQDDSIYYIGIDTSLQGNDYTVAIVIKYELELERYSIVSMYRDRKKSFDSNLKSISQLIEKYNPISIGIEVNSSGIIYYEQLSNLHLNSHFIELKTTSSSKPNFINKLNICLERRKIIFPPDNKIISEFLSFRVLNSGIGAVNGKNDDIIMALAFALQSAK